MKNVPRAVLLLAVLAMAGWRTAPRTRQHVRFTTTEASWLSFDISPDGRWIALDILGDLWRLPIAGGTAQRLTNAARDSAEFLDPVIAPDGRSIMAHGEFRGQPGVFLVSATGGLPKWVAPDGQNAFVEGGSHTLHSPTWLDARRILQARHDLSSSIRGAPTTTIVVRDVVSGAEHGIDQAGVGPLRRLDPVASPDGSELFFTVRNDASTFPPSGRLWRMPLSGGHARPLTSDRVQAYYAAPSPDGRRLAYLAFDSANVAQVWLQGIDDSASVQLTDARDVQPTRIRWMGSDTIIYAAAGRLWRMDTRARTTREIPFRATIEFDRTIPALPPVRFPVAGTRLTTVGALGLALAPDGESYATIAFDTMWIVGTEPTAKGRAQRALVAVPSSARSPTWSPDGRQLAWSADLGSGADIYVADVATGRTRRLTALPGDERAPRWSPKGDLILITHAMRDSAGRAATRLRLIRPTDSLVSSVADARDLGAPGGPAPVWNPAGTAVFVYGPANNIVQRPATLRALDGSPPRPVRGLMPDVSSLEWLASGELVFASASRLWRAPFDESSLTVGPAAPLADDAAMYATASRNGRVLYVGESGLRLRDLTRAGLGAGTALEIPALSYVVPMPPPLLVRRVRVLNGDGADPSAPRDVLMRGGRIERIAAAGTLTAPSGATVVDAENRIAIPGLIDLHEHSSTPGVLRGLLYFGVTTVRNVGGNIRYVAAARDAVNAGAWYGPRFVLGGLMFQTDYPFTDETNVGLLPERDARQVKRAVGLLRAFDADLLKLHSYVAWAEQMRTVEAAHALGKRATGHCGYPLALLASGIDAKEHLGWECTLRDAGTWNDDLVQLYRAAGVPIIPTLVYRGFWIRHNGHPELLDSPELQALVDADTWAGVTHRLATEKTRADVAIDYSRMVDAVRKLHRAGVVLGAGTDIDLPDGVQSEMEELVAASLSPREAIASATSVAARIIGAENQVGRIAPGLLGDLVILDADPTSDISNTRRIWRVVQGGRVVDRPSLVERHGGAGSK